jgi:hypothetical protein
MIAHRPPGPTPSARLMEATGSYISMLCTRLTEQVRDTLDNLPAVGLQRYDVFNS